jgi:DNA phosphorothioation-dependent restriction protein DptH
MWTELHGRLCADAIKKALGAADQGTMAFVRCLTPDVVEALAKDASFAPLGWEVWRVAEVEDGRARTITADRAVELRESKGNPVLLLVDTARAGAGMDGIYSAAQEVDERDFFSHARRSAGNEVTRALSRDARDRAERALKKARGFGRRLSISHWAEFDFLVRIAATKRDAGELLYLLGLWPSTNDAASTWEHILDLSRLFVDRLLGIAVAGLTPGQRIETLKLINPTTQQLTDLERFLRSAATKPALVAFEELSNQPHLWINALHTEAVGQVVQSIELVGWRTNNGRIAKWSGLIEEEDPEHPPVLVLKADVEKTGDYSKLELRWKTRPDNLEKGSVAYRVAVVTDMDEELCVREVSHGGKKEEKCRFTNDDFTMLSDDALISAKVVVSVLGSDAVEPRESEEFTIRFGEPPERQSGGVAKGVRTFSEGVIEVADRETVSELVSAIAPVGEDSKGFLVLRTRDRGKSFRVFRPALIREVEQQWAAQGGTIARWRVKVRASGSRAGDPELIPIIGGAASALCERAATASRRMADRFANSGGGVGQIYDDSAKTPTALVKEYLLSWAALLEEAEPLYALANTVEVQSLSGRTIGLIVLPSHPLRMAWHVAYDNLVLYAAYEQAALPKHVREEFKVLDGSMFPPFLPGLAKGTSFVYADTLRFHAVGMVPDDDKEPKAAVAILGRALGEADAGDAIPTVGRRSAEVLGDEILKYIDCHDTSKLLHIHALRPGDGLTVARSLGHVQERYRSVVHDDDADTDDQPSGVPSFVLELYPSREQRAVSGRFIAEAREKRRRGAGVLAAEDQWMLDSVSLRGGMNLPRLRWARKGDEDPRTAAHLAVAFDTFESRTTLFPARSVAKARPMFAFGLMSFFEREYTDDPSPLWRSTVLPTTDGEKHPSDRTHSERLARMQQVILRCVARNLGSDTSIPTLTTEISPEKAHSLRELHRLCDWVITLDRNAGIEYFDSPTSNKEIYDAYVIDCVPEREDLGCLQLITSTSNLEEVRNLLDTALDQMGLSQSRRNAEFLLGHLKALSGRLAIRLTGQKAPTAELVGLALSYANCRRAPDGGICWTPLRTGYLIPIDDVLDLIPPLTSEPEAGDLSAARPDLIYVTVVPRKGLLLQFIEVKYRRHLRAARGAELLDGIRRQVSSLRDRWDHWFLGEKGPAAFRAIRRTKLGRVLRFYADKARRHYLALDQYDGLVAEIDRMVEKGDDYSFANADTPDRGWVFCPEYAGGIPLEISPSDWQTRVYLFGPGMLPDSDFRRDTVGVPPVYRREDQGLGAIEGEGLSERESATPPQDTDGASQSTALVEVPASEDGGAVSEPPGIALGDDFLTGAPVRWAMTIKGNPHLLVAGLPGMGKTTCLLNMCQQMLKADVRPIVFSYHEDIDQRLQEIVGSVRFVDYHGLGFNPLQVLDRSSRTAYLDVAGALRDIFVAVYPELGDVQGERIRKAIKDSFIEQGWADPVVQIAELPEPLFARFVDLLRSDPKPDRGLRTLLGRLEELSDYGFFDATESQTSLWESDRPTVIRIHATQNENLQKAFASLVFYGLYKDMFRRGIQSRITHSVIFDEAHRAAKLRLIPTMAKECRKYGISLVLASQEAKDFNISVFSAIANYLVLRLNEADAKVLVRNVASSDQERALIDRIKQMERFKALYFAEGKKRPSFVSLQST